LVVVFIFIIGVIKNIGESIFLKKRILVW